MDDPLHETTALVRSLTLEADDVISVVLESPSMPPWQPGAHIDVVLRPDLVRQYSLCSDPDDPTHYRIAVLREMEGRGGSRYVHDCLRPGETLTIRGPRNNFDFLPSPRYLFIAGGIGITPLLPMIHSAARHAADWLLVYGGRRRQSMAFAEQLLQYNHRVRLVPEDESGLIPLGEYLAQPQTDTKVYCCGPEPLLAAVEGFVESWPEGALQLERFKPRPIEMPDQHAEHVFTVVCARSNTTVRVAPDQSILEALEAA